MARGNPPRAPQRSCANNRARLEERESDSAKEQNVRPKVEMFECVEYRSASEHLRWRAGRGLARSLRECRIRSTAV